ncbi:DUF479 domain-containing protein [Puteibacter caeruleilacunae]|nr:DUF479 domain-containing protein [Puteibacter caeruleilacunae]
MNYLAHIFLSGNNEQIRIGNFIGDHVKGNQYQQYAQDISTGIVLHRQIDSYTDQHPDFLKVKRFFRDEYSHYAGIVTDVLFDHLLASNWNKYCDQSLADYLQEFYDSLNRHMDILPARIQEISQKIQISNRIYTYKTVEGLKETLTIMSRYTSLPPYSEKAIEIFKHNYQEIFHYFTCFFNDIYRFTYDFLTNPKNSSQKAEN